MLLTRPPGTLNQVSTAPAASLYSRDLALLQSSERLSFDDGINGIGDALDERVSRIAADID